MAHETLVTQAQELTTAIASARADGSTSPKEYIGLAGRLLKIMGHALSDFVGTPEEFGDLKSSLLVAYDTFIGPWDIPQLPNTIEPFIKSQLRVVIEAGFGYVATLVP